MSKMNDVFDMSKNIGYNSNWSNEQVLAADKAIKTHDELVKLLDHARDAIADNPYIGPCGLGLVVQIDELLERVKA